MKQQELEKSDGAFDNGQGELSDAAAALDWIEKENPGFSQCWVSGFSFGSLICMQLIMRRPEVNKFIAISPQPNVYDFTFLAPCPISGLIIYGKNDELVPEDSLLNLKKIKHKLVLIDKYGIDGDFVESQAFAYLAIRSYLKLPISFPSTTGVSKPCTGGVIVKN